jgi:Tfp pilus assembly protein PilO
MIDYLQSKIAMGALLLVVILGVGYFFTAGQWSAYKQAKADVAQKQEQQRALNEALSSIQSFNAAYKARLADADMVNLALPAKSGDLPNLLSSVEEMAKAAGVALSNFQITDSGTATGAGTKPALENSIQTQKIDMVASGSYASFVNFMMRLQNNLRLMDVENVTAKADENGQLQYDVQLKTYYQK